MSTNQKHKKIRYIHSPESKNFIFSTSVPGNISQESLNGLIGFQNGEISDPHYGLLRFSEDSVVSSVRDDGGYSVVLIGLVSFEYLPSENITKQLRSRNLTDEEFVQEIEDCIKCILKFNIADRLKENNIKLYA